MLQRPVEMFDREHEWAALSRFVLDDQQGATLGVVSGRRRQGKTFLLDAACRAAGGFFFAATEAVDTDSLHRLGAELTEFAKPATPIRLTSWYEAIDALLALGRERSVPVVLDEFPYLAKANPSLPSIIQAAYGPLRPERTRSSTRLLLCGSAMSFMGGLLSGNAPLRGRAGLEMVVRTLDHRLAARFWELTDPRLAVMVNAVVGGTPAYRRELTRNDSPDGPGDFDGWVARSVLNPETPLFREARYLLAEEPDLRDTALYHSVLGAVAEGNATRGGIASHLGRKAGDLAHALDVLENAGLLARDADAFRDNRSTYRIAEPLITFYGAVMRPAWSQLERPGSAQRVWAQSRRRFESNVIGPRFEQICREWALYHDDQELLGGLPSRVGTGTVNDAAAKVGHEVDVVVTGVPDGAGTPLLSIGEVKWNEVMGVRHLERLRRVRELIEAGGRHDTSATRLACYSGAGFTPEMHTAAARGEVVLVGLDTIYGEAVGG